MRYLLVLCVLFFLACKQEKSITIDNNIPKDENISINNGSDSIKQTKKIISATTIDEYKRIIIQNAQTFMEEFKNENYDFIEKQINQNNVISNLQKKRHKQFLSAITSYYGKINSYKIKKGAIDKVWSTDLELRGFLIHCIVECDIATVYLEFGYAIVEDKLYLSYIVEGEHSKFKNKELVSNLGMPFIEKLIEGDIAWLKKQTFVGISPLSETLAKNVLSKMKQIKEGSQKYQLGNFIFDYSTSHPYDEFSLPPIHLVYKYVPNHIEQKGFNLVIGLVKTNNGEYYLLSMNIFDEK